MWAIVVKEFRQLRRDRRTVAMLFLLPFLFLVVFGYAASFDVKEIPTVVVGGAAELVEPRLPEQFEVVAVRPGDDRARRGGGASPRRGGRRLRDPGGGRRAGHGADRRVGALRRPGGAPPHLRGPGDGRGRAGVVGRRLGRGRRRLVRRRRRAPPRRGGGGPRRHRRGRDRGPLQPRPAHRGDHGARSVRHHPRVHRHHRDRTRRRARAPDRHHGAARRHAVPPARRLHRQDRPLPRHRRHRHGDHRRRRHAPLRRALPWLRRDLRPRLGAVPLRHPRSRRAHLDRVADAGAGDPAGDHDDGAAVPAQRPLLPPVRDAVGRALDRLPAPPHVVRQDRPRGDGARRADRLSLASIPRARGHGGRRLHPLHPAVQARSGAGRFREPRGYRRRRARAPDGDDPARPAEVAS